MSRELPAEAELMPGRYALEVELPDKMLDAIAARPNWTARLEQEVNERATGNFRVLGAGVQHNSATERVFVIAFEVIDPYANGEGPSITVSVLAIVPIAVIVASISAVLFVAISGHYTVKVLDDFDDPGGVVGGVTSATKAWAVVVGLGIVAWAFRGRRSGVA